MSSRNLEPVNEPVKESDGDVSGDPVESTGPRRAEGTLLQTGLQGGLEIGRTVELVRTHPAKERLAALAYDVLSRQAEGRTLFAGKAYVDSRAKEHSVERADAATDVGNLLGILERGAENDAERDLVAAFAVAGLDARLRSLDGQGRSALAEELVRHADWLELGSPYAVYGFVDLLLERDHAGLVWRATADATLADVGGGSAGGGRGGPARERVATKHDYRARNTLRASALAASTSAAARLALARIATDAQDPITRGVARALGGGEADTDAGAPRLQGRVTSAPRGAWRIVRWVVGVAAATWVVRGLLALVGTEQQAELRLVPGGVQLRKRTKLMGRVIRERDETFTQAAIAGLTRHVRYPALHTLVGLAALSLGILIGGAFVFDGVRSGETILLLIAAVVILFGAGLDLALDVLVPARKGRVQVDLAVLPERVLRLEHVSREDADRFIAAIRERFG